MVCTSDLIVHLCGEAKRAAINSNVGDIQHIPHLFHYKDSLSMAVNDYASQEDVVTSRLMGVHWIDPV